MGREAGGTDTKGFERLGRWAFGCRILADREGKKQLCSLVQEVHPQLCRRVDELASSHPQREAEQLLSVSRSTKSLPLKKNVHRIIFKK